MNPKKSAVIIFLLIAFTSCKYETKEGDSENVTEMDVTELDSSPLYDTIYKNIELKMIDFYTFKNICEEIFQKDTTLVKRLRYSNSGDNFSLGTYHIGVIENNFTFRKRFTKLNYNINFQFKDSLVGYFTYSIDWQTFKDKECIKPTTNAFSGMTENVYDITSRIGSSIDSLIYQPILVKNSIQKDDFSSSETLE